MGNITGFILAGHSFGGYIVGNYAAIYPQHIIKLMMLSPAGVPDKPPNFDINKITFGPEKKSPGKIARYFGKKVWKDKWSPFKLMRGLGSKFAKRIIKGYLKKRMGDLSEEESAAMHEYLF